MKLENSNSNTLIHRLAIALILLGGCSPSRLVRPLNKGEQAIGANLGGPMIIFAGAPIPVPLTSAFYARGITDKTSVFGSLHATSAAFGVLQTDIGVCTQLYSVPSLRLGFTVNPALNAAIDRWEWNAKLWPQLDLNVYKEWGAQHFVYAGLCNWFELSSKRPHGETQPRVLTYAPQAGIQLRRKQWNYGVEMKWLAPNLKNQPNVADYIGINHQGAVGVYFQIMRRF